MFSKITINLTLTSILLALFLFLVPVSVAQAEDCGSGSPDPLCTCDPISARESIWTVASGVAGFFMYYCEAPAEEVVVSPVTPAPAPGINYTLVNPLSVTSFEGLLTAILNIFIIIATPIIILAIIYAGFKYVTAKGDSTKITEATTALTYAVIGGVILLGSVALSEILANIIEAFRADTNT